MLAMYNGQNHAENDQVQLWKNRGLGPLGPSILDPIYVIYVFGSMLSCILCEWQKFSESPQIEALWCPESVQSSAIFDRFLYWI